jgi:hypothetical protein
MLDVLPNGYFIPDKVLPYTYIHNLGSSSSNLDHVIASSSSFPSSVRVHDHKIEDHLLPILFKVSTPCFVQFISVHTYRKLYSKMNWKHVNPELYWTAL